MSCILHAHLGCRFRAGGACRRAGEGEDAFPVGRERVCQSLPRRALDRHRGCQLLQVLCSAAGFRLATPSQ